MGKPQFSKLLAVLMVVADVLLSAATLALCFYSVYKGYSGSLPYLTALIGLYQAATGWVCGKYMDKSKAENTEGGVVYARAAYKHYERDL